MMERTNLAIKCNFCNGGSDSNKLYYGYNGVCTQGVIEYNITKAKYDWCKNPRSPCNRFFKGKITYDQLLQEYDENGSVCYESAMLERWEALAGWDHNGVRGDRPRRILDAKIGSLAVLTLVTPNSFEYERRIFALFIVHEYYTRLVHAPAENGPLCREKWSGITQTRFTWNVLHKHTIMGAGWSLAAAASDHPAVRTTFSIPCVCA